MDETSAKGSGEGNQITTRFNLFRFIPFLPLLLLITFIFSCAKDDSLLLKNEGVGTVTSNVKSDKMKIGYEVTNLVSDVAEYNPVIIDTNLVNAWGIALSPTGVFWISAADKKLSVIYN